MHSSGFSWGKIAPGTYSSFSFTFSCFFFQFDLPFCYFELFHSTSLCAMFVYSRGPPPPPNNPINARAPSLGARLSLFSEVSLAVLACSGLSGGRDVAKRSQPRIRCECSRKRGRFHHVRCPYCKYLGALNRLMQP